MFEVALPARHPKRLLEATEEFQGDSRVPFAEYNPQKRIRNISSPSGRCGGPHVNNQLAYSIGSSTILALKALFPQMNDKVISDTLAEFGDNVDAAIKHLNELQLSAPGTSKQHAIQEQQRQGILPTSHKNGSTTPPSTHDTAANVSSTSTNPTTKSNRTADEWIDLLVQEMAAAGNVDDAKLRAANVLQSFEQAISEQHNRHINSHERPSEIERENAVLKRAVAIQNARLRELTAKETELNQARHSLEAAHARVQALEMQNYTLQLHLKQAADSSVADGIHVAFKPPRNPDVF